MARMANTTGAEVKAFLLRESRRNLGPSVTTSMLRETVQHPTVATGLHWKNEESSGSAQ